MLAHLALISVDLDYWFTSAGLLQGNEARLAAGPLRFSPLQYVQDPVSVRVVVAGIAAVAFAFVLGWRTRIMGVLLYLGLLSLYHRNISSHCGPDQLLMLTCFYMMLSPCGAAYSLDARREARRRGGTLAEPLIIPWAQRLLQVQLCLVYFATAAFKCTGATWLGGTAIHYVLFNHEVGQFNMEWLANFPVILNILTLGALVIEFSLPFLLWFRPARKWVAVLGVLLHIGIVPLVNVPLFGEQMTASTSCSSSPMSWTTCSGFSIPAPGWAARARNGELFPPGSTPAARPSELSPARAGLREPGPRSLIHPFKSASAAR